jgi:hypothetical protein
MPIEQTERARITRRKGWSRVTTEVRAIEEERQADRFPGIRVFAGLTIFYTVIVLAATWPYCLSFASKLPANGDPLQHLWIMRWYKTCWQHAQSPFLCPAVQYPVGAPFGCFSPLHIQSLLYFVISELVKNDALCYNLIWLFGLVSTGVCTFAAAWCVTRDRLSAAFSGLLAMLSAPVMLHAHAHLELHFLGALSLFLIAWPRFLDRPSWGRLAASSALYLLMTASAAYFAVLVVGPAAWAVAWQSTRGGFSGVRPWLRTRIPWLLAFIALSLPGILLLLSSQIWSNLHGFSMTRSLAEFEQFGTSLWTYAVPTDMHPLGRHLPFDVYAAAGYTGERGYWVIEKCSYLGIISLLLLLYTAACRVAFRRAGLWWSTLAVLVILSLGASMTLGSYRLSLPAYWLWRYGMIFRLLRSPARFNLLAAVVAAVVAAAGLRHLLARLRSPVIRALVWSTLAALAIADLRLTPYSLTYSMRSLPASYSWLKRQDPGASLLELPLGVSAERTYWQALHGCATSEGYTGVINLKLIEMIGLNSPFPTSRPNFLMNQESESFGPVSGVAFRDYAWLFLTTHRYKYVILHRDEQTALGDPSSVARLRAELERAKVFEDEVDTIYERARFPLPSHPVVVCTEGWRTSAGLPGPLRFGVRKTAHIALYNPTPDVALTLAIQARSVRATRVARIVSGGIELARWHITPGAPRTYESLQLRLPAGLQDLTLETDGESTPAKFEAFDQAKTPLSLQILSIKLNPEARPSDLASPPRATDTAGDLTAHTP